MSYKQALCEPRQHEHRGPYFSRVLTTPAVLTVAVLLLFTGCGPRDGRFDPSQFRVTSAVLVPPQVVVPKSSRPGKHDGLFLEPANGKITALCCWIGTRATLRVKKVSPAHTLSISVYVPKVPQFEAHAQQLTVVFQGQRKGKVFAHLKTGFNSLTVPVPKGLRQRRGAVPVLLKCEQRYIVPAGQRQVDYGVLLTSIYFT